MLKNIIVLNALLLITATRAQLVGSPPCEEFDVAPDIDNEDHLGIWYQYAKTPRNFVEGVNSTCNLFDRLEIEDDEWPFVQYWVDSSDGSKYFHEDKFKIFGPGVGLTTDGADFTTVYADDDVLVTYACKETESSKSEYVWVLTRIEYPDPSYLGGAFEKMKELGINKKIKRVKHDYCPEDWSDAEEKE